MTDRDSPSDIRFIQACLRSIKRHIKFVELGSGALLLLAYTMTVLTVVVVADHAHSAGLSAEARRMARWAFLLGAIGLASWLAIMPALRRINDLFAARAVEHHHPEFKNSLISALQLLRHADLPGSMQAALAGKAAGDLSVTDVGRTIEKRPIRRAAWVLASASGLFVLYALLAPKPVEPSIRRALGIELPPPTRTQIVIEQPPADFETMVDTPVRMIARITGRRPDEAYVQFSADGGRTWLDDQQLGLSPPPTVKTVDPTERQRWRAVKSGRDVQASMHYRFVAGDARSEVRLLRVRLYPEVADVTVRCEYPEYTGLSPTSHEGGSVDAVVGTQVTVQIRTTVPAESPPMLSFRKTERGRIRTEVVSQSDSQFTGRFRIEASDEYTIDYRDLRGVRNRDPIVYVVKARPDGPPQIALDRPEDDVTLSASDAMGLVCDATDDFGLTEAMLEFRVDERPGRIALAESVTTGRRMLHVERDVPLSRMDAGPGQEIVWWVTVRDNRHNTRGNPAYQSTQSEKRRITIRQDTASDKSTSRPVVAGKAKAKGSRLAGKAVSPDTSKPAATRPQSESTGREDPSAKRAVTGESDEFRLGEDLERFVETHRDALAAMQKHLRGDADDASSVSRAAAAQAGEEGEATDGGDAIGPRENQQADKPDDRQQPGNGAAPAGTTSDDEPEERQAGKSQQASGSEPGQEPSSTRPSSGADEKDAAGQGDAEGQKSADRQDQAGEQRQPASRNAGSQQDPSDQASQQGDDQGQKDAEGKEGEGKGSEDEAGNDESGQKESAQASDPSDSQGQQGTEGKGSEDEAGKEGEGDTGNDENGQKESAQGSDPSDSQGQQGTEGKEGEGEGEGGQEGSGEESDGQGQQDGQDEADGKGEGEGKGKGEGETGEGQSKCSGQSDCECASCKASNPESKAGPEPTGGGGAMDSFASNAPTPASPTTRPELTEAGELAEPTNADRAQSATVDRAETLVNELERQLREGQLDPDLLKALGWTPDRARRFVREFRRLEQDARPARSGASGAQGELRTATSQPGDDRWRAAAGRAVDVKGATMTDRRAPDEIRQLLEVRRQQVGKQYRDLFEAYYKTVANLHPAGSATTRPTPNR